MKKLKRLLKESMYKKNEPAITTFFSADNI